MKKPPGRKYELAARFERAVRQLPGSDKRRLLDRLCGPRSDEPDRDFYVLDLETGRWRRL